MVLPSVAFNAQGQRCHFVGELEVADVFCVAAEAAGGSGNGQGGPGPPGGWRAPPVPLPTSRAASGCKPHHLLMRSGSRTRPSRLAATMSAPCPSPFSFSTGIGTLAVRSVELLDLSAGVDLLVGRPCPSIGGRGGLARGSCLPQEEAPGPMSALGGSGRTAPKEEVRVWTQAV